MNKEKIIKKTERIDQLSSQGVQIIQSDRVFAFSIDAVLLADFVKPNLRRKTLTVDLCSGNGAIALFLNKKIKGKIVEVELQPKLADMAKRSVLLNGLDDRYTVINDDIANIYQHIPKDKVDIVTCNPPYFKALPTSQKNPNPYLAIARHELKTNLHNVVTIISGLLKMNGKGYLVHRPERLPEIINECEQNRLRVKRVRFAYPKPNRPANIVLIELIKDGRPGGMIVDSPVIIADDQGEYTEEIQAMLHGK